ncbi:MAG: hypothetical protein JJU36_03825 [Phycisphaeraceae bacterium]|nr:hypothetical protein [Phycisphaeraceae bacterium]
MKRARTPFGGFLAPLLAILIGFAPPLAAEEPQSLAEEHWPLAWKLPEHLTDDRTRPQANADILAWVPENARRIRAVLIIPNNTDSKHFGEHEKLRQVAQKHQMGIVFMRRFHTGIEHLRDAEPNTDRMPALMRFVAEQTGIAEFAHAPWVTFGKSSRGEFPFRMGWLFPERTIASVSYHAETPTWPIHRWAKTQDQSILHVNAMGETEWGGTWFVHVRPSLLNYRARTAWLPHILVVRRLGHGDYRDGHGSAGWGRPVPEGHISVLRVWDYLSLFMDKALELRLPAEGYPTRAPITLRQVDPDQGFLIDRFAVENLFNIPKLPLREGERGYISGSVEEPPVSGYAALEPLPDFQVPEGVPVVRHVPGQSPEDWILTDSLKFAMDADPMLELPEHLRKLMPKVGDKVTIDGHELSFAPIIDRQRGPNGGIRLDTGLKPRNRDITLLAFTVLEIDEHRQLRVDGGYTAATRIQLVINGQPVRHRQVLDMKPGKYPLLVVLRMAANWGRIEPGLSNVSADLVEQAKEMQVEMDRRAAEQARLEAERGDQPIVVVHKAASVPAEKRAGMFWVADLEQAKAWLKFHNVHDVDVRIGGVDAP